MWHFRSAAAAVFARWLCEFALCKLVRQAAVFSQMALFRWPLSTESLQKQVSVPGCVVPIVSEAVSAPAPNLRFIVNLLSAGCTLGEGQDGENYFI